MITRTRLDQILLNRGLVSSAREATGVILSGRVLVDGKKVDKPGLQFDVDIPLEIQQKKKPDIGRGAEKLRGALDSFRISPEGKICADLGSSTGGFSSVLLERGAEKVYAVDKAKVELAWVLRNDPRVVVLEETDASSPINFEDSVELVVIDVSLLSLRKILPAVCRSVSKGVKIITLFKPQYEATADQLPEGAVIKDPVLRDEILNEFLEFLPEIGLICVDQVPSSICGTYGNQEVFLLLNCICEQRGKNIA